MANDFIFYQSTFALYFLKQQKMNSKNHEHQTNNISERSKSVLITGANKSIGFETARQLLQQGYYVYLGSRNEENGIKAVNDLKAEGLHNVEAVQLDVTDQQSVDAARARIGQKTDVLDVLINNAGISGVAPQKATDAAIENFKTVYDTNVYGVVRVTQA